jgi:phospholipid transport system substrate-binding protein
MLNTLRNVFVFLILTLVSSFGAWAATQPADQFVREYTQDLLTTVSSNKQFLAGDPKKVAELVDGKILPVVNFQRMTAAVLGRHWRVATPEQKQRLLEEFRALLIRTYSGAISQIKDLQIEVKPLRANSEDNDVVVKSVILRPKGEPIALDYRLERTGETWKVIDLNVAGLWLVETYRTQFSAEINRVGIDGLIASLLEKSKAVDKTAK